MDATLRPWHLKVDYQLNDENGNPSRQGVFEYWWSSPKVYRSSWASGDAKHSEWHTADGKNLASTVGAPLSVYEYWLRSALVSPLPSSDELDPAKIDLVDHALGAGAQSRCIMAVPSSFDKQDADTLPFGTYPEYCVNKRIPILLGYYQFEAILIKCMGVTMTMQGKAIPREVIIIDGTHQVLDARVEPATTVNADDPAFIPAVDAAQGDGDPVEIGPSAASALIVSKVPPVLADPVTASKASGKVILEATIGSDGGLRDVRLVSTQAPGLALPAFRSVAQWRFKPYQVQGKPVSAEIPVEIDFPLTRN